MNIGKRKLAARLNWARTQGLQEGAREGYARAQREAQTRAEDVRAQQRLQEAQYRGQSIDAICHAITALARLVDGRDAR